MGVGGLNLAGVSTPLVAGNKPIASNRPASLALSFQVRCEGSSRSQAPSTIKVARREIALCLTAVCLSGAVENAEARIVKPEIRKRIREKLEMLRQKAGLSKKKDVPPPPPPLPPSLLKKEKKIPLEPPPLPLPALPESSVPLVEATVAIK